MSSLAKISHCFQIPTSLLNFSLTCVIVCKALSIDNTQFKKKRQIFTSLLNWAPNRTEAYQFLIPVATPCLEQDWSIQNTWWMSGLMTHRESLNRSTGSLSGESIIAHISRPREQRTRDKGRGTMRQIYERKRLLKAHKNQELSSLAPALPQPFSVTLGKALSPL